MDFGPLKPRDYAQRRRKNLQKDSYLFDADCVNCIATVPREQWEVAAARFTGNVALAARHCGLSVPEGTLALWGTGPEDARTKYLRRQQEQATAERNRQRKPVAPKRAGQGETVFLFDQEFKACVAEVSRSQWEPIIAMCSGDIVCAATYCGLEGVPVGARALRGDSVEDALSAYCRWREQQAVIKARRAAD